MKRTLSILFAIVAILSVMVFASASVEAATLKTPAVTKTEALSKSVKLTWGKVSGAAKYRVFLHNGKQWTKLADTTATNYTYTKVKSGTSYKFTVRCVTKDGKKFTSGFNKNGYSAKWVAVPKLKTANTVANGIEIQWNASKGASKYRLFYKTSGGSWKKVGDTTATKLTYTGAAYNTDYTFTARPVSKNGKVFEGYFNTTGLNFKRLATPAVSVKQSGNNAVISWNKVNGAAKYRVFCKTGSGSWKGIADTAATSFTYTGAAANTPYSYTVRAITADGKRFTSYYNTTGVTFTINSSPSTDPPTQPPTQPATQPSTPTSYITPTVRVYDGKVTASWNAVSGANKYVVSISNDMVSSGTLETKTVTGTSATMNYTFTNTFSGSVVETSVVAYKNSTALTKPKTVNTTIVGKWINSRSNDRIRSVFTIQRDINFCNSCGQWMENAYQYNISGKLSTCAPYETDVNHQTWHTHKTDCPCTSYRCWLVHWPSGLMNYEVDDNVKFYKYYSVVDSNWSNDYYPTITSTVDINSIKKVNFSERLHVQQLNNIESERGGTNDPLPLMQADGALEITFTPKDKNIKIYDIWVKTTNAKSVNKLTQLRAAGDKLNGEYMYNAFDNRWTYDAELDNNDWAVIGQLIITDTGYTSHSFYATEGEGKITNKVVKTTDLSSLTYTLPNWYGNQYNSCYDWNMLDNNTKYEFAIQPRLDRTGKNASYSDTVPAAPRGSSKSYTWTGRDYEYYTENNAYFLGASLRNQNFKTKPLEVYAEQKNLDWQTWGQFMLYTIGYDDHTGKEYISETGKKNVALVNNYRIPVRTDFEHTGSLYVDKKYCDNGIYALSTRTSVFSNTASHTENAVETKTIASHGLYARTPMYDVWSKRNERGKHITLIDHKVNYYDPLCYEYTIDGGYKYYYESIPDSWVKQRPKNYVAATPDGNAARKSTDTHLWDEIREQ